MSVGFLRAGIEQYELAFHLDPLSPQAHLGQATALWLAGRIDEADAMFVGGRARWPDNIWMWFYHYWALLNSEKLHDAAKILRAERPPVVDEAFVARQLEIVRVLENPNDAYAIRWLDQESADAEVKPHGLQTAQVLARANRLDAAYAVIERVMKPPWGAITWGPAPVRVQPGAVTVTLFAPTSQWLRKDPRFAGLCARLGLASYWRELRQLPDCAAEVKDHYNFAAECANALSLQSQAAS